MPMNGLSLAALAAAYFLAGKIGLQHFAFLHASASPVWLPAGIALAGVLLAGPRMWPAIFVAAFLVNVTTAGGVAAGLAIAAGNTAAAVLGAHLVTRWAGGARAFDQAVDIFKFVAIAAVASAGLSA